MVKHLEDGLMIVEQIVPFFAPDYTLTLKDVPGMNIKKDVPVVLKGFSTEDNYDGPWDEKRVIQWTLSFTAQAYLYPPIKQINVTTEAEVNMRIEEAIFRTDTTTPYGNTFNNAFTPGFQQTDATTVEDGTIDSNNNS
jgi:hypothetical protein